MGDVDSSILILGTVMGGGAFELVLVVDLFLLFGGREDVFFEEFVEASEVVFVIGATGAVVVVVVVVAVGTFFAEGFLEGGFGL
jgi:hypothetical protein